jgi:hypothetical protein
MKEKEASLAMGAALALCVAGLLAGGCTAEHYPGEKVTGEWITVHEGDRLIVHGSDGSCTTYVAGGDGRIRFMADGSVETDPPDLPYEVY